MTYYTPAGFNVPTLYADMLKQTHVLIAGTSGAGKSTATAGFIYSAAAMHSPAKARFVLVDPKRMDLKGFKDFPHTVCHVTEPADICSALRDVMVTIERRYQYMSTAGAAVYDGARLYVIIDELADLMTTNKAAVLPVLQRILQVGRGASVSVVACTQCPLTSVIPTPLKCNLSARLGLRTVSAQDSRNILGVKGCETLPKVGRGIYLNSDGLNTVNVPMVPESEIARLLAYWKSPDCTAS